MINTTRFLPSTRLLKLYHIALIPLDQDGQHLFSNIFLKIIKQNNHPNVITNCMENFLTNLAKKTSKQNNHIPVFSNEAFLPDMISELIAIFGFQNNSTLFLDELYKEFHCFLNAKPLKRKWGIAYLNGNEMCFDLISNIFVSE